MKAICPDASYRNYTIRIASESSFSRGWKASGIINEAKRLVPPELASRAITPSRGRLSGASGARKPGLFALLFLTTFSEKQ